MNVVVITPSIRQRGLDMVYSSLKDQTYQGFQWVVCSPFIYYKADNCIPQRSATDDFVGLAKATNDCVKSALELGAELIINTADLLTMNDHAIENLVSYAKDYPTTFVSGIVDHYKVVDHEREQLDHQDVRRPNITKMLQPCTVTDCDWAICSIPVKAWTDTGGIDETFDRYAFGGDKEMMVRAKTMGYSFAVAADVLGKRIMHERIGGQAMWDRKYLEMKIYLDKCLEDIEAGKRQKI